MHVYRFLEIIPATLSWTTILLCVWFSIFSPYIAMLIIIAFDLYWLLRILYLSIYLLQSWRQFSKDRNVRWWNALTTEKKYAGWDEFYHLIFLPTYKEPISVLEETFESLLATEYDHAKYIICLTGEEPDIERFTEHARILTEKYARNFFDIVVTVHPKDIPGEIPGKGSNLHHAGQEMKTYIDEKQIPYDRIIVSAFDCDTQPDTQYFAYLMKTYLETPDPQRASYQPIPVYNNIIWKASLFTRLVANSTTFWLITELSRPEKLLTFSSHSMSWQMLVDVGFWQPDIVSEDTRIFLQAWMYYGGNYRTVPLFVHVSMTTPDVDSMKQTAIDQYKQVRRWAWGVEHTPYLFWNITIKKCMIPLHKRVRMLWNAIEGMYTWATMPLMIFIMGYAPFLVLRLSGTDQPASMLEQSTPVILSWLMRFSLIGIGIASLLSLKLLPKRPDTVPKWYMTTFILQWVFVPVSLLIFGSIPALEAQTRLALGKYLGFWVSKKRTQKDLSGKITEAP